MRDEFRPIRANLEQRRQTVLTKLAENRSAESGDDITHGDSLDIARSARDREITFMLKSREVDELRAIEDAIERIDSGEYGICASCEDPIEIKRLEAVPWARFCRACQEERESRSTPRRSSF
ncbi:RNA polymerase-binding transcription factor DksA [Candidatus Entotheonellaceae bacterium PAL068K]